MRLIKQNPSPSSRAERPRPVLGAARRATLLLTLASLCATGVQGLAVQSAAAQTPPPCSAEEPAPAVLAEGLTNMGFETGLEPWRPGTVTDYVGRTDDVTYTAPYEGAWMGQLGTAASSADQAQTQGANELCQDFTVTNASEQFVYNLFTYDYTGFDEFRFRLSVTDPQTGEILASYSQGAWGEGTELKTSGWKGVKLDLSAHVGQVVRLVISAGGTSDSLYPMWAYFDSAETLPPTVAAAGGATTGGSGSVTKDAQTGEITISMPNSDMTPVQFVAVVTCPEGQALQGAPTLNVSGQIFEMVKEPESGPAAWGATIPAGNAGTVSISAVCDGKTFVNTVGQITLYDPSGLLTDAVTGLPIRNAKVTLKVVPGWSARTGPEQNSTPDTCESNESKETGAKWAQPAPTELGVTANPYAEPQMMSPKVNPFISNQIGYYGWDVAAGCYYVVVTHPGYQTLTSPVVGVPSEVTDLNLQLTPKALGLDENAFSTRYIKALMSAGFTGGCSSSATALDYCKNNPVIRGDMAIFLSRGMGGESFLQPYKGSFTDVPSNVYYATWAERLADSGVTTGCTTTTFCPLGTVTRGQMALFLLKAVGVGEADLQPYQGTFGDVPNDYFGPWIEELARRGVTGGCTKADGQTKANYCPGASVTREQMAIFLVKTFNLPLPATTP